MYAGQVGGVKMECNGAKITRRKTSSVTSYLARRVAWKSSSAQRQAGEGPENG